MNYAKLGNFIAQLRKEKNLTQKQLAERLNITDKAISKWECGQGCPDVSLLQELSDIFGVNIAKILQGDLEINQTDNGNIKRIKFYLCPVCGNILTSTGKAEIFCCGRKLAALEPKVSNQEHQMSVTTIENDYYLSFTHEMTKTHYINFIAYVSYDRVFLIRLYPEQGGEVRFPKLPGGKIYFSCNQHGLWINKVQEK